MKRRRKQVLVVDDDSTVRAVLQELLKSYGYTCDTAKNGAETLRKLTARHYDVVLLDYMMPDPNGLTVLQRIRQGNSSIPVVMMTGHPGTEVADLALTAGAQACLHKPFIGVELERALECSGSQAS